MGGQPNVFQQSSNAYAQGLRGLGTQLGPLAPETSAMDMASGIGTTPDMQAGLNAIGSLVGGNSMNASLQQATSILGSPAGANPYTAAGANLVRGSAFSPQVGSAMQGLSNTQRPTNMAMQGFAGSVGNQAVQQGMGQYMNPYQENVIDDMITRMRERRNEDLNMVRAQAAQSGAFGGARQGLVEAQLMDDYAQQENESIMQALQGGFDRAAALGQQQQQLQQAAAQGLTGIGAQELQRQSALGNLGLGAAGQTLNAGNALANIGQNTGAQDLARAGQLANIGQVSNDQRLQQARAQLEGGIATQQQQLAAANLLAQLGGQIGSRGTTAAGQLVNSASLGQQLGMNALQQQAASGAQVQALNQQLLNQATGQYDAYINYPQTALATALAGVQGNPLAAATNTTQTTSPGLFNYLSLGAGLGAARLSGGPLK